MKYIRTKDGIIDLDKYVLSHKDADLYILKSKKHRKNGQDYSILYRRFVLKEADSIEELCDEFVFVDEFGKKDLLDDDYKAKLQEFGTFSVVHALMEQDRPKELYGAVWTDKGLIYVAEMNEELEMELK